MSDGVLYRGLIRVLGLISLAGLALGLCLDWTGYLVNFAAGLLTLLVGFVFVNLVIQRHEKARREPVQLRLGSRLQRLVNECLGETRTAVGYGVDELIRKGAIPLDPISMSRAAIEFSGEVVEPLIPRKLPELDAEKMRRLWGGLEPISDKMDKLMAFADRMDPAWLSKLLDWQDSLSVTLTFFEVFPEYFFGPFHADCTWRAHRDWCVESLADSLVQTNGAARSLSEKIEADRFSDRRGRRHMRG